MNKNFWSFKPETFLDLLYGIVVLTACICIITMCILFVHSYVNRI
jgi:hypothetical protein